MSDDFYPEFLYRYRPYSTSDHKQWVREIILENKLYAPSPTTFNDPFDCKINLDMEASDEDLIEYAIKLLKDFKPDLKSEEREVEAAKMMESGRWMRLGPDFLQPVINKTGVISFSSVPDDVLMWSHYADSHRGVAFQFRSNAMDILFGCSLPIDYRTQYPSIKAVGFGDRAKILEMILVKSADWRYENEYRHITYEKGVGHVEYRPDLLTGVILGCDMKDRDKEEIMDLVSQRKHKPLLYQARREERRFGLVIEPF